MKLLKYNRTGPTYMTRPYGTGFNFGKGHLLGTSPTQNHQVACHEGKFEPTCAACQELKRKGAK